MHQNLVPLPPPPNKNFGENKESTKIHLVNVCDTITRCVAFVQAAWWRVISCRSTFIRGINRVKELTSWCCWGSVAMVTSWIPRWARGDELTMLAETACYSCMLVTIPCYYSATWSACLLVNASVFRQPELLFMRMPRRNFDFNCGNNAFLGKHLRISISLFGSK